MSALAQILALIYSNKEVQNIQLPPGWASQALCDASIGSIRLAQIAQAEFDPFHVQTEEEIFEELGPRLRPLFHFCEKFNVLDVAGLTGGEPWLSILFDDFQLRPKILKYLHWRR